MPCTQPSYGENSMFEYFLALLSIHHGGTTEAYEKNAVEDSQNPGV